MEKSWIKLLEKPPFWVYFERLHRNSAAAAETKKIVPPCSPHFRGFFPRKRLQSIAFSLTILKTEWIWCIKLARFDGFQDFPELSEFCSNVLTRNPLSFSWPDSWLSTLSKNVNKAVFQKWSCQKMKNLTNFRVFSQLELSKAWNALKKSSLRKEQSDRSSNCRVFSHMELSKAWNALKKAVWEKSKVTDRRIVEFSAIWNSAKLETPWKKQFEKRPK
jgi:hypothetical protein